MFPKVTTSGSPSLQAVSEIWGKVPTPGLYNQPDTILS
jgi:hypothetical protein